MIFDDINAFVYPYEEDKYIKLATVVADGFAWSNYISIEFLDKDFVPFESFLIDLKIDKIYDPRIFWDEKIFSVSCHQNGVANQLFFNFSFESEIFKLGDFLFDAKSIRGDRECKNLIVYEGKIFYDFSRNLVLNDKFEVIQRTKPVFPNLRGGSNMILFEGEYLTLCHGLDIIDGLRQYSAQLVFIDPTTNLIKKIKKISLNPDDHSKIPLGLYKNNDFYLSLKEVVFPVGLWKIGDEVWSSIGLNHSKTIIKQII